MAPPETKGYKVRTSWAIREHAAHSFAQFNHTMIRVKDPKASLKFYCDVSAPPSSKRDISHVYLAQTLGMELIHGETHP